MLISTYIYIYMYIRFRLIRMLWFKPVCYITVFFGLHISYKILRYVISNWSSRREEERIQRAIDEYQAIQLAINESVFKLRLKKAAFENESQNYNRAKILKQSSIQRLQLNHQLIRDLARAFNVIYYPIDDFSRYAFTQITLLPTSAEYQEVYKSFTSGNNRYFNVEHIIKINNIFLQLHYLVLKAKLRWYHSHIERRDSLMFHGTKKEYAYNICCWNFDKRKVKTHKFGKGTSFARNPYYSTYYHHDNKYSYNKVMIIAQVLDDVGPSCIGSSSLVIPPAPSYTSTNLHESVTVKFDDASFFPRYVICYSGLHPEYNLA